MVASSSRAGVPRGPGEVVTLTGPRSVRGDLQVPGDKSISHRALLLAGLASGVSTIRGLSSGEDVARTRAALASCGVGFEVDGEALVVRGGLSHEPDDVLDLGNSGTAMRLLAGVFAGQQMFVTLTGDRYLRARPMNRVVGPLREMGATIDGRADGMFAPLAIRGGKLAGISYRSPLASAQVKSAVLLAGLTARGRTTVIEPVMTRRHTEELLTAFGLSVLVHGTSVTVDPADLVPSRVTVKGDPSQAAFWVVAGLVAPDSAVQVENVYLGPGRTGFLDVLQRMGADIRTDPLTGTLSARSSQLHGVRLGAADIPNIIDEVPALAIAAAAATGTTVITGAAELRVKESDRIATTVAMLTAFGCDAQETSDGILINGGASLRGAQVDSHGDHRIAMSAAIGSLIADGTTTIDGWGAVITSYPGFLDELRRLTTSGS